MMKSVSVIPVTKHASITCYLCGREFQSQGFSFHYKECTKKFSNQQIHRSKNERVKAFSPPSNLNLILSGTIDALTLNKYNQQASAIYKHKILSSCIYCLRTFNHQSLITHMNGCDKRKNKVQHKQNIVDIKCPKSLICCVCGQRFGTKSLRIHYPQCTKNFIQNQFRKHKKQSDRRNPPKFSLEEQNIINSNINWTESEMQDFNQKAMKNYRQFGMKQCDNCKRRFFDEQLQKHRKNCELINGKLNQGVKANEPKQMQIKKPKTIICIICGRDYGVASIWIHVESCISLFQKKQILKPKQQRKNIPLLPQQAQQEYKLAEAKNWTVQQIQEYNKLAFNVYNTKSLAQCYVCKRTFFQQSLPKHMKHCESKIKDVKKLLKLKQQINNKPQLYGSNYLSNVLQISKQINQSTHKLIKKPNMLMCYLCGREYGSSSLKIHQPQCLIKQNSSNKNKIDIYQNLTNRMRAKYNFDNCENWTKQQITQYNKQVYTLYKKQSLYECKYCHRTFFQESLKKHIKHCQINQKKQKKLKKSQTMKIINYDSNNQIEIHNNIDAVQLNVLKSLSNKQIIEETIDYDQQVKQQQSQIDNQSETYHEANYYCQQEDSQHYQQQRKSYQNLANIATLQIVDF